MPILIIPLKGAQIGKRILYFAKDDARIGGRRRPSCRIQGKKAATKIVVFYWNI